MTSSLVDVRIGSQLPRIESYPLFHTTAADDAIDLAAVAGLDLDPWQQHVLRGALGERQDGKWSAFRVALVVPRQNGKNALLEARELAGLFLFGEQLIIHTAHQYRTAKGAMKSMMRRLKGCPDLLELVDGFNGDPENIAGFKIGNNEPGITLKSGAQLQYATRGKDSGRGFTGDLVVLDEAYSLKVDEMAALVPTMAATSMSGNPQLWLTSSAGMPESDLLASLREHGVKKDSDRLAYFEWSAGDDATIDDVDAWYEANPGLGIRISEEFVRDELDTLVTETGDGEQFKRERMGIWAKLGVESVISPGAWAAIGPQGDQLEQAASRERNEAVTRVAFAVDVPPGRDSATICMAGDLGDDRASVVVIDRQQGTDWVPARLAALRAAWSPVAIVVDAGAGAGTLLPDLKRLKVPTLQVSYRDYALGCASFFDAIGQGTISHSGQDELDAAVDVATQTPIGDSLWKWNRKSRTGDISPLVAATLALHGLNARKRASTGGKVRILS